MQDQTHQSFSIVFVVLVWVCTLTRQAEKYAWFSFSEFWVELLNAKGWVVY